LKSPAQRIGGLNLLPVADSCGLGCIADAWMPVNGSDSGKTGTVEQTVKNRFKALSKGRRVTAESSNDLHCCIEITAKLRWTC
jgi:hypothetical protein